MVTLLMVAGYLLGSISSAVLVCRALRRTDPRTDGSRNPGATNVLRIAGRDAAALTLSGDVLKGVLSVGLARALSDEPLAWTLAGAAAFYGHLFPVFFGFVGGKGVATALGAIAAATPWAGLLTAATWLVMVGLTRISSVGALTAFALAPLYVGITTDGAGPTVVTAVIAATLFWRHRGNIRNLLAGTET
jgi:glycerol-3-phosphate acyltransferase PlsY